MLGEDKKKVCELLQEIETDLAFGLAESYREGRMDDFVFLLELSDAFLAVKAKICA